MKDNLSRLCPAIARELEEAEIRNKQKQVESQREAALEALRQSEEKHRTILENIEEGYYEVDLNGNFTFFNASMCRTLGYPPEEMMGMNNRQFTDKENAKKLFKTFNEVYRTGEPAKGFDWQIIRKDGTERYIEVSVSLQKNSSGEPIGFRGISRDITERKQKDELLKASERQYHLLAEHMTDIVWMMNLDLNVTWLSPSAVKARGFSVDEIAVLPLDRQLTPESLGKAVNWLGKLMHLEKDRLISEPDGILSRELEFYCKDGRTIVLDCTFQFIRDEQGKATGILAEGKDITTRKRAEKALRVSEEKYRLVVENAKEGIIIAQDLNLVFVNRAAMDMIGYSGEILVKPFTDFIHPDDRNMVVDHHIRRLKGEEVPLAYSFRLINQDGTVKWVEFNTAVIQWKERPATLSFLNDITERKQAEEVLRQSEEKYRTIIETIQDGYFEVDLAGNFTFVNDAQCRIVGTPREQMLGKNNRDYTSEEEAKRLYQLFSGIYRTGEPFSGFAFEFTRIDGTKAFQEVSASLIRDAQGKPIGFRGVSRDVTERKKMEEALRQNEERYRNILNSIQEGYFEFDLVGKITFINDTLWKRLGYSKEELLGHTNEVFADEATRKESFQAFSELYKTGVPVKALTQKNIRKDGSIRISELSVSLMRDSGGKPVGFFGTSRDVTERKQMEEVLRQSEEKYRTIIETMQDGYFETDLAGRYTFANEALRRRQGHPKEELIGMSNRQFQDETNAKKAYQAFNEVYRTGEPIKALEMEVIKKDGTSGFSELSVSLIRDAQGKPIGFRGISHDVTERRQAEEVLRQSEEKYRTIIETIQDGYFETDLTGKFTFVNDAECNNLGYTRKELIEMAPARYAGEENRKLLINLFIEIYKTGIPVKAYNLEFTKKDGTTAYNEISVSLIRNSQGEPIGFRGIARDVTERKQAEEERKQSFERMRKALGATVHSISVIVEMKDPYTSGHQQRVSDLARSIATEMGLSADQRDFIRTASAIHDIGKISIPSEILSKPTRLTALEFNLIKTHAQSGYDILKDIEFPWPVADVVLQHHERIDGSGYPQGLKGDDIPLEARIIAVADVVEAIASHRPYRPALGIEAALEEIEKNKGILYDNTIADACLRLFREKSYQLP
jgi:PAS domain S-box-containing protein